MYVDNVKKRLRNNKNNIINNNEGVIFVEHTELFRLI